MTLLLVIFLAFVFTGGMLLLARSRNKHKKISLTKALGHPDTLSHRNVLSRGLKNIFGGKKGASTKSKAKGKPKRKFIDKLTDYVAGTMDSTNVNRNLAMVERTKEEHAKLKVTMALLLSGLVFMLLLLILVSGAIGINPILVVLIPLALAFLFYWLPDSILNSEAEKKREEFEQAMLTWLDLASQMVTTGTDAVAALMDASSKTRYWPFRIMNVAMRQSLLSGRPAWEGLNTLVRERGLTCLEGFIDSLEVSLQSGAEVSETVRNQIRSIRKQAVFDAEAAVDSSIDRSVLPLALLVVAFLILLVYPGISGVLNIGAATNLDRGEFGNSSFGQATINE